MSAKEHYDTHLAAFYSWMTGDFDTNRKEQQFFLEKQGILPASTKVAIDLGAGHGIQSAALATLGFSVKAIDFNRQLLDELTTNCKNLDVTAIEDDIRSIAAYKSLNPELIVCSGDTLTHLENDAEIKRFIDDCCDALPDKGKLLFSFRDYSEKLSGDKRFIPVKSDDNRILTCFLDYTATHVLVTDLLYERTPTGWQQKISSYKKVRVPASEVADMLTRNGMRILFNESVNRIMTITAEK
jgi:hypothetical protein